MYRELITQLCTYVSAIRILTKGYLPNTLIKSDKLQVILTEVKKSLHVTNPDYTLVLYRLHLYYDMQLVTFGIDKDMNLVIQLPVFKQPYTQKPLILYQLEMVPIPIPDRNTKAQFIHTFASQKALYYPEFRNIYLLEATGIKIMQKDLL